MAQGAGFSPAHGVRVSPALKGNRSLGSRRDDCSIQSAGTTTRQLTTRVECVTTQDQQISNPEHRSLVARIRDLGDVGLRACLAAAQAALAELPQNSHAWTYTIRGFDQSPYLTRTLLPRAFGRRVVLHRIHREDQDRHMHDHPWSAASFLVVSGGYVEQRLDGETLVERALRPGDINRLTASTWHRVTYVAPDTWTVGILGDRVQDWGFRVDGAKVPWREYFARKGHDADEGVGQS